MRRTLFASLVLTAACSHPKPAAVDTTHENTVTPPESGPPYRHLFERDASWRYAITSSFIAQCASENGCEPIEHDGHEADDDGVLREGESTEATCKVSKVTERGDVTTSSIECSFPGQEEGDWTQFSWTNIDTMLARVWAMRADGLHEVSVLADAETVVSPAPITLVLAAEPVVGTTSLPFDGGIDMEVGGMQFAAEFPLTRTVEITQEGETWCSTRVETSEQSDYLAVWLKLCFHGGAVASGSYRRTWTNPETDDTWPGVSVVDEITFTLVP